MVFKMAVMRGVQVSGLKKGKTSMRGRFKIGGVSLENLKTPS